jgi:hypothetical protein
MKTSFAMILFIFSLFPLAPAISAQSNAYHCILYTKNAGKDVRFSSTPVLTNADVTTLNAAWKQYVAAAYHVSDPQAYGGCQALAGTPAQQEMVVTSAEANYKKLGAEVVHVNWTSAPGQTLSAAAPSPAPIHDVVAPAAATSAPASPVRTAAAAPVAAPAATSNVAAPSAPVTSSTTASTGGPFIICATSGGPGIDTYLTGVFQTTRLRHLPSRGYLVDQSILDDFYAYLTQKNYNFKPGSNYGCAVQPTEAGAKADELKRQSGCSNCGKIVETGWKE